MDANNWPAGTLLQRLGGEARAQLLALGTERVFPHGAFLIRTGDPGNYAILLLDSVVKIVIHSVGGFDVLLGIRVRGDLVGELAVIGDRSRSADVIACGTIRTRVIGRAELDAFLQRMPEVARAITGLVGDRLQWSDRRRVDFVARTATARLAHVLVEIADTYGLEGGDRRELAVTLTQGELGSLSGMARRTVEKSLAELARARLVELRYRRITVTDIDALRDRAELA